jgi:hypothetical protein
MSGESADEDFMKKKPQQSKSWLSNARREALCFLRVVYTRKPFASMTEQERAICVRFSDPDA